MIVGLTGTKAAGKGIIAQLLIEKGYNYLSLSDLVREEASRQGLIDYSVFQLQRIGENMRQLYGNGVLAKRAIEKMLHNIDVSNYVIDGIRNLGEIVELRKQPQFLLISVDAPIEYRFERLLKRARITDPKDWNSFLQMDAIDKGIMGSDSSQQVYLCMQKADFHIYTDSMHGLKVQLKEKISNYGLFS